MNQPDVVVIGAGPAGGTAAWLLASRGVRVTLVDRAAFPRPKLCGGCLASTGVGVLRRVGLAPSIDCLERSTRLEALELRSSGGRARIGVPAYLTVDRAVLDREIVEAAVVRGVRFVSGARATVVDGGCVAVETENASRVLRPGVVIVADGLWGTSLDRDGRFPWETRARSRVGIGTTLNEIPDGLAPDAITMMHAPEGYLGAAPMGDGRCVVAAAVDPAWIRAHATGGAMRSVLARHGVKVGASGGPGRAIGAGALSRRRARVEADGRIFLIGDAAGYIEPFTGEGMSWAIEHAERVAPIVLDAIEGVVSPGAWTGSLRRWRRRRTVLCRLTTSAIRSPALTRAATHACARSRRVSGLVSGMIGRAQRAGVAGVA